MSERNRPAPEAIAEHGRSPATPQGPSGRPASIPEPESLDAGSVLLDCYELARLPAPVRKGRAEPAANLPALVDRYDAFILDGYGVINVGPEPIPGIGDAVRALSRGRPGGDGPHQRGRQAVPADRAPLRRLGSRHAGAAGGVEPRTRSKHPSRPGPVRDCGA